MSPVDAVGRWTLPKSVESNRAAYRDKAFIECNDSIVSWGEFADAADGVAAGLLRTGLQRGEHVAILMDACPEYIACEFGILRAGLVAIPCGTLLAADELKWQLEHSDCRALICDREHEGFARAIAVEMSDQPDILLCDPHEWGSAESDVNKMIGSEFTTVLPAFPNVDEPAIILYTSGTTARPKGIRLRHGHLMQWTLNVAGPVRYRSSDRVLHFFPLYHGNGGIQLLMPVVLHGATLVMTPKFSASRFGEQVTKHRISVTALNASHIKMILRHPVTEYDAQMQLDRIHFSLPLEPEQREEFARRFNDPTLLELYGFTEALGIATCTPLDGRHKPGSQGVPTAGYEIKLVSEDGVEVPTGQPGELWIRSAHRFGIADGYHKDPEATAAAFSDGWFRSGDVGTFDEDGYFWFGERSKDMIKRSGFNVAPREVERVLASAPRVKDVAVVGIPDEIREESIIACVLPEEEGSVDAAVLRDFCAERLADYKVPERFMTIAELPTDRIGKVDKKKLRRLAEAEQPIAAET